VTKSVTDKIVCDSGVEVTWAEYLQARDDIPLFIKLPGWFLVSTPLGNYNPDWAFVRTEELEPLEHARCLQLRQEVGQALADRRLLLLRLRHRKSAA